MATDHILETGGTCCCAVSRPPNLVVRIAIRGSRKTCLSTQLTRGPPSLGYQTDPTAAPGALQRGGTALVRHEKGRKACPRLFSFFSRVGRSNEPFLQNLRANRSTKSNSDIAQAGRGAGERKGRFFTFVDNDMTRYGSPRHRRNSIAISSTLAIFSSRFGTSFCLLRSSLNLDGLSLSAASRLHCQPAGLGPPKTMSSGAAAAGAVLHHFSFRVSGKVQGVFFRKHTHATAERLKIGGWVMNHEDGSVVGEAEGKNDAMESFRKWLSTEGSPKSRIDSAEFTDQSTGPSRFGGVFTVRK